MPIRTLILLFIINSQVEKLCYTYNHNNNNFIGDTGGEIFFMIPTQCDLFKK